MRVAATPLEESRGKDGDLPWLPFLHEGVECPASLVPCLEASEMVEVETEAT